MTELCDLQILINGQQTFFLHERIISAYSTTFKRLIKQNRGRSPDNSVIIIDGIPGGPDGFEIVTRFCYNKGSIQITVSNVCLLHCCGVFFGMTENNGLDSSNLIKQTETFLEEMYYWSWEDILVCLNSCVPFFNHADSSGLLQKLICALLVKIAQISALMITSSSNSSSSSPENRFPSSAKTTPESIKPCSSTEEWWFNDMTILPPKIIEKVLEGMGSYRSENNSLVLTRFLLHYLKIAARSRHYKKSEYGRLADTAVHGVISAGKTSFSCRGVFWVLRVVGGFGVSKECRNELERMIGGMLNEATLDDLLVSAGQHERGKGGIYDVNLVMRLIRVFVNSESGETIEKMKKVGRLVDKYLGEISPDQHLKISKFLGVAESLPSSSRDCFDGVYRAIDIYLESHQNLSMEERSRLCRCLDYEKLSLEACKDLAKNPRIPPRVAVEALISQQSKIPSAKDDHLMPMVINNSSQIMIGSNQIHDQMMIYNDVRVESITEENEDIRLNIQKMQYRVVELEKVCKEMKGHMSRLVKQNVFTSSSTPLHKALPKLC